VSGSVPEKIGKYPIESLVAKGGMGAVYKAVHPELKRPVIIKKLTIRGNAAINERFTREARILLDLQHPHIVHLFDYFLESGSRYLVLEFVDGLSLDRLLRRKKRFSGPMALLVLLETCVALKFAHDHGIIHRDVKPGNILISRKGSVKLADFGIASDGQGAGEDDRAATVAGTKRAGKGDGPGGAKAGTELTVAGAVLGTPSYMPPEQFADSSAVDARADIYAAGVMLYEMLTGQKPFPGGNTPETREAIRKGKYPPVRSLAPDAPALAVRLVRKMMRPNPKKRYSDLGPVIKAITRYLKRFPVRDIRFAMVQNMLTSKTAEPPFQPVRRPFLVALVALVGALALAGASTFAWNEGLIHRFLLRPWYAPVNLRVELPSYVADSVYGSDDLQFRAFFFRDDGGEIPEVPGTRRVLEPVGSADDAPSQSFAGTPSVECRTVWLRPGAYRLKLVAGPRIWWESFSLDRAGRDLSPRFGAATARSLSVRTAAFDAATGRELPSSSFYVMSGGAWLPLSRVEPKSLRTGTVQKFRVTCEGYQSMEWSLRIGWYQDELVLDAGLEALR